MDLSRNFILLNGEPKTLQIDTIERLGTKGYRVRFKNNGRTYNYGYGKVTWLANPEWLNPQYCKVLVNGILKKDVKEIWKFDNGGNVCWRIVYCNGFVQDDACGRISVCKSCLQEDVAKETFAYLRNVSVINPLGKNDHSTGTLFDLYSGIDFIDDNTATACYLNPSKYTPKNLSHSELIYPFGCNASQKRAVAAAFEHQVSVIQGPPGTGKTQTILNIIANIVRQGKTVMVVSNNNSATANVQEKLEKYGLAFFVAPLGSKDNKEVFIASQPDVPAECATWKLTVAEMQKKKRALHIALQQLDKVFGLQNERTELLQEHQSVALEWKHFCIDNGIDDQRELTNRVSSERIISIWMKCQMMANNDAEAVTSWIGVLKEKIKWWWMRWTCKHRLHIQKELNKKDTAPLIQELQALYYLNRQQEIMSHIGDIEHELSLCDAEKVLKDMTALSMDLFKSCLHEHYSKHPRFVFAEKKDLRKKGNEFMEQYPVVLSTTFSARSCVFTSKPYDYIIMDEASQVPIETGMLALTCAENAVVVGDTKQLPNVITEEDRLKLNAITEQYNVSEGYDCAKNSFLQSVLAVIKNVPETMLREHYRCHPRIINFCNQKFYGGKLLVMTEDKGEDDVLLAIRTVKGNHAINQYNQREIDVVKEEVLPKLKDEGGVGIITPYNNQVDAFNRQLDAAKAGTIHKYQGREEDTIIMSVVDNQITLFADDANMLNVAVSRAKKKFILVVTGNEQKRHGNIMELTDYIAYNNCTVTESKLASIFDYLYEHYAEQRMAFLSSHQQISKYASENLTYNMLNDIIASDAHFGILKVLCHVPLRQVVKDTSLMSEKELKYAANYNTHLDFLFVNRVSKKPVLAVETDGYSYHNEDVEQHQRDLMKDHILSCYGLPLLRLSTKGSGEREKVFKELQNIFNALQAGEKRSDVV